MAAKKKAKKKAAKKQPAKKKTAKKKNAKKQTSRKSAATPKTSATPEFPVTESAGNAGAPPGNQFWRARSTHGRQPLFDSPEALEASCIEYFEWCQAHPMEETKVFAYEGDSFEHHVSKLRPMTVVGLCAFLKISRATWDNYRKRDDFLIITEWVEAVMYEQKFSGAAVGLLSANLIARELGLRDGTELTGKGGTPLPPVQLPQVILTMPDNGRDNADPSKK